MSKTEFEIEKVPIELVPSEWKDILDILRLLGSREIIEVNNPERAVYIRDQIVKQLP